MHKITPSFGALKNIQLFCTVDFKKLLHTVVFNGREDFKMKKKKEKIEHFIVHMYPLKRSRRN